MRPQWSSLPLILGYLCAAAARDNFSSPLPDQHNVFKFGDDRPPGCPPCFNCNLDDFPCHQFAPCRKASGRCECPPGFGGNDCSEPLCGSLAEGKDRPTRNSDQTSCECNEGWEGINCNVCKTNDACNAFMPEGKDGVCYREGLVQKENYQICDITNRKIVDQLDPRKPQATFSCNAETAKCNFQFWTAEVESFYCDLDTCISDFEATDIRNTTKYSCENVSCRCIPGRMLCGEDGSIDISDFLVEEIKGPAVFNSISTEGGSKEDGSIFSEPHMNNLISQVFGDKSITLRCHSGECLYKTDVPGYEKPVKKINTPLIAGVIAGCALFVVAIVLLVWYLSRRSASRNYGPIHLSDDDEDAAQLIADHKPASLQFEKISYNLKGKQILYDVQGAVRPGEMMAILGASGAGKTTFLDILARKNKRGITHGNFYVNGEVIADEDFRGVVGFVDQDDTLLPTLTVHETILDSARLRLPKDMSYSAKLQRVEDVERQLGIYHIRDQIIGSDEGSSGRGISGGEKRRVGIACELVTSPSILFLDEPTSGLDAFNAYNVVECLVNLAKVYNRTIILTIHQPRSNIVALFDQLVLLSQGRTVYSGPFSNCQSYFDSIGYACPPGFNIADYLVDLTMHAGVVRTPIDDIVNEARGGMHTRSSSAIAVKSDPSFISNAGRSDPADASVASSTRPATTRRASVRQQQERKLFTRQKSSGADASSINRSEDGGLTEDMQRISRSWLRSSRPSGATPLQFLDEGNHPQPEAYATGTDLDSLVISYYNSDNAATLRNEIKDTIALAGAANGAANGDGNLQSNGTHDNKRVKGYRKANIFGQFIILSVRTWRNLYRNPMLMLTHYAIAILLAVFLGFLFYGLTDDIAGFQNRLGLFFFVLALFGFSTLTSLTAFATERLLFVRERAKGYYTPISYFTAKVLFDIIPLRLIPPIILGAIVYPMTGLIPAWPEFLTFILFLVLFNLTAATISLFVGIVFRNGGVANLVGSLVMLFSLLFSGFLLNHETIPKVVLWLQNLSIFHYAFEALIVNEVKYLSLTDHKYGLDIEVPGSAILSSFGFDVQALWMDCIGLAVFSAVFILLGYAAMHLILVERR